VQPATRHTPVNAAHHTLGQSIATSSVVVSGPGAERLTAITYTTRPDTPPAGIHAAAPSERLAAAAAAGGHHWGHSAGGLDM
jgi:hypothetical protein